MCMEYRVQSTEYSGNLVYRLYNQEPRINSTVRVWSLWTELMVQSTEYQVKSTQYRVRMEWKV